MLNREFEHLVSKKGDMLHYVAHSEEYNKKDVKIYYILYKSARAPYSTFGSSFLAKIN